MSKKIIDTILDRYTKKKLLVVFYIMAGICIASIIYGGYHKATLSSQLTTASSQIAELKTEVVNLKSKLAMNERSKEAHDLIRLNDLVDPHILKAVIMIESSNNPRAHNKGEGAIGLMQLRPIVYEKICGLTEEEAFDPVKNVSCGAIYIKHLLNRFNGNLSRTLQYYNSGHRGNVKYIEKIRKELNCKEELLCLNQ